VSISEKASCDKVLHHSSEASLESRPEVSLEVFSGLELGVEAEVGAEVEVEVELELASGARPMA
jgi:hypothetical protein